jgi:hypothetical protein
MKPNPRLALALLFGCFATAAGFAQEPRPTLHFLGVAYDESPPKGQTVDHYNYAPDNFAELFQAQSAPLFKSIEVATLKGEAATRDAVMRELRAIDRRARPEDLVFVYWGTHGGTAKNEWSANLPGGDPILGSEMKSALGRLPCQVVVAISTCGSGGFIRPEVDTIDLPKNVTAFAACQRRQSASNELDVSLLEAMAGFGDLDGDGIVKLAEVIDYVPRRYRKLMREQKGPDTVPVLGQGKGALTATPLSSVTGRHAGVIYRKHWYGAVILEDLEGRAKVRYLGWDPVNGKGAYASPDEVVDDERIDPAGGEPPAEVEWNGTWYPAKILNKTAKGRHRIHYVGYPASDDEVVTADRIRFPFVEGR